MIKYAKIPGFYALGEVSFGSHLYQFVEQTPGLKKIVLIRAYDTESKYWVGLILYSTKEIINHPNWKIDLTDVKKILPEIKKVSSFKNFIKGNEFESYFKDYKISTNQESNIRGMRRYKRATAHLDGAILDINLYKNEENRIFVCWEGEWKEVCLDGYREYYEFY